MTHHVARLLLLLVVIVSGGCESIDRRTQATKLDDALRAYESAIRWNNFAAADQLRTPDARNQWPADLDRYKSFRVTSYALQARRTNPDHTEMTQVIEIQYYNESSMHVRTVIDEQVWRYDSASKQWSLHGPLPNLTP